MKQAYVDYVARVIDSRTYDYEGNPITFNRGNSVMVSATEMAKPFGKRPSDWLKTQSTKDFIETLSGVKKIAPSDLVQVTNGDNGGTWLHEDVAMEFARWLSPKFAIWTNDRIKELMQVGMTATPATLEAMLNNPDLVIALATQVKQLRADNEEQRQLLLAQGEQIAEKDKAIAELHERTSYLDQILNSKITVTTTQIAADYGMSAKKFNVLLRNLKIQRKVGGQWILYAPYNTMGYTHSETFIPNGSISGKVVMNTKWTQKGRLFLYDTLKKEGVLPLIEQN